MINKQTESHKGDILIVDDDLPSLSTLSSMLTTEGYEVRGVPDGKMALTVIENKPPELILLDVKMPGMDGFEVCQQIKADEKSSGIPILFLSALDEVTDKIKGFEAGAVDFITKPFQAEEVLARVDAHITLSRLNTDLEAQVEKRTEEIKESEERYHIMVEALPVLVMTIRNKSIAFVNSSGARLLGFSDPQRMIGMPVLDMIAPESSELAATRIGRLEKGKDNPLTQLDLIRRDGTRITVESTSVSIPIGGIPTAVVIAQDISERKELETKLKESEEQFRTFMDNNPSGIYIKDENDTLIYGNPVASAKMERTPDELIGLTTRDIVPPEVAERLIEIDRKVLKGNIPRLTEEWSHTIKEEVSWFRDIKFPIKLESGKRLLGGIAIDITEIKANEERLQKAYGEIKSLKEKLEQENIHLQEEIQLQHKHDEIIGKSDAIKQVLRQAEQVAETDSTVLILGETGTGKELLARAIHRMSSRRNRSMHIVNCAAMPSTLIESEMFGCEKGAFTGALSRRIGRFEIADGSTIFLDEIGELSMEVQMKLLRVLEGGQFERLGGNKTVKVDVRVIAATNRDLEKSVHEGGFRRDLYYRLNVFPITVPPLRDRIEDMDLLIWAFVKEFGERMGKRIERIPRKQIEALEKYPWKGNVRELRNVIEQSMIVTRDTTLNVQLPGEPEIVQDQGIQLEDVERNHIQKILEQTGWRVRGKGGAAEHLGLKESTLRFRMKKLGIHRP